MALFPDTLEDSEIGPIPEAAVSTIHDIAKQRKDMSDPAILRYDALYWIRTHAPKIYCFNGWGSSAVLIATIRFAKRDILFGKLRPYLRWTCPSDVYVLSYLSNDNHDDLRGFLLPILSSEHFVNFVSGISEGVGLPRTKWSHFKLYKIALPPAEIREKFASIVRPLFDKIESSIYESKKMNCVRAELLPKLMSDELSVSLNSG